MDDPYQRKPCSTKGAFCRLCFSQNHKLQPIFPPNDAPNQLLILKIEYCTGIRMSITNDSNACICVKCIDRTEKLFRFKQICIANDHWLKMDSGSGCLDNGTTPNISSAIVSSTKEEVGDRMIRADSCESLLTIGTEQLEEDFPGCDEEYTERETDEVTKNPKESTLEIKRDYRFRPRKQTSYRHSPETLPADPEDYQKSSTAFSMIRGTKSRSGRLYLVYKGYHYSDYQSKKNVYRCTQRTPVYCRAKVLLEKGQVYELNDNTHDHPLPRKSRSRRTVNIKV